MSEKEKVIELVDLATDERIAWLEREQQENDNRSSSRLGLAIFAGSILWGLIMLLCSACTVNYYGGTEYVDSELAAMSDGISGKDRHQLNMILERR